MKQIIQTPKAPVAIGPYSQAVKVDGWVFLSGQIALDPETAELVGRDVAEQTRRVLDNLKAVLEAAGGTLDDVVKTTIYLHQMRDYVAVNDVYAEYFNESRPARAAVQVEALPRDALVEIDAVARLTNGG